MCGREIQSGGPSLRHRPRYGYTTDAALPAPCQWTNTVIHGHLAKAVQGYLAAKLRDPRASVRDGLWPPSELHGLLQFLRWPECHFSAGFDLDRFAGGRVTPHSGSTLANLQNAESGKLDPFATFEVLGD